MRSRSASPAALARPPRPGPGGVPGHVLGHVLGHVPALDGVRAVALLAVLAYHTVRAPAADGLVGRGMLALAAGGWAGVDLFFVLSGFLVTRILLDTRGAPGYCRSFAARRALRILPLYYLTVAALVAGATGWADALGAEGRALRDVQGWYWTHLANVLVARDGFAGAPLHTGHLWSLAVEEQFYLVWPLVVAWCPPRQLGRLCGALVAAAVAVRCALVWAATGPDPVAAAYVLPVARMDALALGAWLAVVAGRPGGIGAAWPRLRLLGAVAVAGVGAVAVAGGTLQWGARPMQAVGYTMTAGAAVAFVAFTLRAAAGGARTNGVAGRVAVWVLTRPALRYVGRRSYALYLLHYPLIPLAERAGVTGATLSAALGSQALGLLAWTAGLLAVTLALAEASWRLIERPCLALKDRIAPRPVPAVAPAAGPATARAA